MTITRLHMSITVLIALALHGGMALWLGLPSHAPNTRPSAQSLRVSLLAAVDRTTAAPAVSTAEPQAPEPMPEPRPAPEPLPEQQPVPKAEPVPEPVVQDAVAEPQPPVKPAPLEPVAASVSEPVETMADAVRETAQPSPTEPHTAPLDDEAFAQYGDLFRSWLEKHKVYPRNAQRLRIEGEGMLRILIDRTGRIRRVVLEKRTGNRLLDRAAVEMARRADPFPPVPETVSQRELEFIVPVVFALR